MGAARSSAADDWSVKRRVDRAAALMLRSADGEDYTDATHGVRIAEIKDERYLGELASETAAVTQHVVIRDGTVRTFRVRIRYAYVSELDLLVATKSVP